MISCGLISVVIFCLLAIQTVVKFIPSLRELGQARSRVIPRDFTPPARVILCLRGADPFLDRCLRGLVAQDYPNYNVIIVVDSLRDEAMPQVERLLQEHGHDRIEVLIRDQSWSHCTRKICSLLCGLNRVPAEVEVVAVCDADVIPHPTWLLELVAPLQDPQTVAASGNRWYAPTNLEWGGMSRYYWNALAFPAMSRNRILWGGSLAMRGDLFRDPEYLNCLQHAFSEDTALAGFAMSRHQQVAPIVSLVILNEETSSLKNFRGFLVRQLLAARLHHPRWPSVVAEAAGIFVLLWVLLPLSIFEGWGSLKWWLAGSVIYNTVVLSTIGYCEWLVRKLVDHQRGQFVTPYTWQRAVMSISILSITGFIYTWAVLQAMFAKSHEWRGIVYRIDEHGVSIQHERENYGDATAGQCESV